ncbi:hypothetical protein I5M27_10760 [Adhaeribacter sp. BT258]|uniref:Lipocalin-like domain-containing protein n=1 Tax=Adhaeribacter terrigena TaxID=2793070 RepID=A0ABS1C243_9BACT|nr:DUF6252 family protein [Adhaeribacter terrigena]MBK0403467.1 hypothetical protein [Adhaeribacter terrigena]
MNFKRLPFTLFVVLCFLFSCSKDDDTDKPAPAKPEIKATIAGAGWQAINHNTAVSGGLLGIYGEDGSGRKITISMDTPTKTGTYTSGSLSYELTHADNSYSRWTGFLSDSTVNQLTITSYDANTKKFSGTFRFTGQKVFGGSTEPDSVIVTGGTFTDLTLP